MFPFHDRDTAPLLLQNQIQQHPHLLLLRISQSGSSPRLALTYSKDEPTKKKVDCNKQTIIKFKSPKFSVPMSDGNPKRDTDFGELLRAAGFGEYHICMLGGGEDKDNNNNGTAKEVFVPLSQVFPQSTTMNNSSMDGRRDNYWEVSLPKIVRPILPNTFSTSSFVQPFKAIRFIYLLP